MNSGEQRLSIEEAKQMDMVEYLSKSGHEPAKIRNDDYWYLSPLRDEKTASFKINRKLNRWYDHGSGKGGNLIDFGILYYRCSVAEFLHKVNGDYSFNKPVSFPDKPPAEHTESKITIRHERPLSSLVLCRYLQQRRIPVEVAGRFCNEIVYQLNGKEYFGIGFKNDSGGYELRNPYFKAGSAPKDITTINNGSKEVSTFEGFTDFLSFISIHKNHPVTEQNFLVLNSVSFFEKARPFMEQHEVIHLYLDRDTTGQNYSRHALSLSNKYRDESRLYEHYKDLNDWAMNMGKAQQKNTRQKLH